MKFGRTQKFLIAGLLISAQSAWAAPQNPARTGIASWYSETDAYINKHTANGEIFDDTRLTCAAWDYPFNTYLEVKNLENGKTVICRVNDRGPSKRLKRTVDLTKTAFKKIANPRKGLITVSVRVVPLKGRKSMTRFNAGLKKSPRLVIPGRFAKTD